MMTKLTRLLAVCATVFLFIQSSSAQQEITTVGDDFWFGYLSNYENNTGALQVFVSSETPASGIIEMPLMGWSEPFVTTPGVTTVIDVPFDAEHTNSEIIENKGIHLTSDTPVSVYCISYTSATADGTRILPKTFLDVEYVVSAFIGLDVGSGYKSEMLVVATEDGTELVITPSVNLEGGAPAGTPFTIQLNAGQTYHMKAASAQQDVSGTTIVGTEESGDCRPFAVFGGSECPNIPDGCTFCDHIFDQTLPTSIWGQEHLVVPFRNIDSYSYRVMSSQDGTDVQVDGVPVGTLNAGEFFEYNFVEDPVYVTANNPINVIQYMEGTSCVGSGDPAMCSINPNQQRMSRITFATVVSNIINQHSLNVIVSSTAIGNTILDGVPIAAAEFQPFPANPAFSYAQIIIAEGNHTLENESGFIAYVYGLGNAESYAYSTGAQQLEPVEPIVSVNCDDGQVILQGDPDYLNPWWSTFANPEDTIFDGATFIIDPPIINEIYILHGSNFLSGCPEEEIFSVESPEELGVSIIPDSLELCLFQEYTFSPEVTPPGDSYNYSWSNANSFIDPLVENGVLSAFTSGYYYLDVSTFSECSQGQDSVWVDILGDDITFFDAVGTPDVICEGDTVFLEAVTGQNVALDLFEPGPAAGQWVAFDGEFIDNSCGSMSGNAVYFNGGGPRFAETIDYNLSDGGLVSFGIQISDGSLGCDAAEFGEDVLLEYSTNSGGAWTTLSTLFESLYPSFQTVQFELPEVAWGPTVRFRWSQPVYSGVNEDIWMLDNVSISSFSPGANTYAWTSTEILDDDDAQSTFAVPNATAMYEVESLVDGCLFVDSIEVVLESDFGLVITNDTVLCDVDGVQLQVTPSEPGFYTYQWNNGFLLNSDVVSSPVATPFASTTFTVEVTSAAGCVNSDSVSVDVLNAQNFNIFTNDFAICTGETINLSTSLLSSDNLVFEWAPADIMSNPDSTATQAMPTSSVTISLTVIDTLNNCSINESIDITVNELLLELPADTVLCDADGFVIDYPFNFTGGEFFTWNNFDILSDPFTAYPTITESLVDDTLILTVSNFFFDCEVTDTLIISTAQGSYDYPDEVSICPNEDLSLPLNGSFESVAWTPNAFLDDSDPLNPVFSNDVDTAFYFTVTIQAGCFVEDTIEVLINIPDSFVIESDTLCDNGTATLGVPLDGLDYLWNTAESSQSITIDNPGLYSVVVTDSAGCTVSEEITMLSNPQPIFTITGTEELCIGETSTLVAGIIDVDMEWSTSSTDFQIDVTTTGTYWAESTDEMGCQWRDSIDVLFRMPPPLALAVSGAICEDTGSVITATSSEVEYLWETMETDSAIDVLEPGFYSLTVTDPFDCATTDSIFVQQIIFPEVFSPDTFYCEDGSVVLRPELYPGFDLSWSTGEQADTLEVSFAGNYQIILDNVNCQKKFPFTVREEPNPELELYREGLFCDLDFDDGYPLYANSDGLVVWEELQEGIEYLIFEERTYQATAFSEFDCTTSEEIFVPNQCTPRVFVPSAFTPDGDGLNDVFSVSFTGLVDKYEIIIFDRWGKEVFRSFEIADFWNGSVVGGEYYAGDGVYNYVIEFETFTDVPTIISERVVGTVTMIR